MIKPIVGIVVVLTLLGGALLWRWKLNSTEHDYVDLPTGIRIDTGGFVADKKIISAAIATSIETYRKVTGHRLTGDYSEWTVEFIEGLEYHGNVAPWSKLIKINVGEYFDSRWPKVLAHEFGHVIRAEHTGGWNTDEHHKYFEDSGLEAKWGAMGKDGRL